jgi:hypothetical protein
MFKKALIGLALATMVACGGEPPASDVGVAVEKLQVSMGPFLNTNTGSSITSFGETVPAGTPPLDHVGDGTYPQFYFTNGNSLGNLSNSTSPGRQIIDWFWNFGSIGHAPAGSNNIHCAVNATGSFAGSDFSTYMPSGFNPLHLKNGYFFIKGPAPVPGNCGFYGFPSLPARAPSFFIMDFNPDGSANANNFPQSWANSWQNGGLHDIRLRVDITFPEFGNQVNRYFFTLTVQGG